MNKEAWQEEAYAALRRFAKADKYSEDPYPWTAEWMRTVVSSDWRFSKPSDLRWWGPVVQRALREKIIRRNGFAPAKSSHGALKARYVGTRFA